jgi:hypothetical protein
MPAAPASVDIPNPSPIEPFMWTLFGRCLTADLGCVPGEIMAFGSSRQSGTVRGWGLMYSPANSRFSMASHNGEPFLVSKTGTQVAPTNANWAFFIRFIGTPKGGVFGDLPPMPKTVRSNPPRLWMSPPIPHSAGLVPVRFSMPDDFSPALVNAVQICKTAENGFGGGDWVQASEGDSNATAAGYSATFSRRTVTLTPMSVQATHSLSTGANVALTPANWSWAFVFVG